MNKADFLNHTRKNEHINEAKNKFILKTLNFIMDNYQYKLLDNDLYVHLDNDFYYFIPVCEDKEFLFVQLTFFLDNFENDKKLLSNEDNKNILINSLATQDLRTASNRAKLDFIYNLPDECKKSVSEILEYLISHNVSIYDFTKYQIVFEKVYLNSSSIQIILNINNIKEDIISAKILTKAIETMFTVKSLKDA